MAGYNGYSKSNNAVDAENCGRFPATRLAKLLNVSVDAIRQVLEPSEWHHTSSWYNETNYYDGAALLAALNNDIDYCGDYDEDDIESAREQLTAMRDYDQKSKAASKAYRLAHPQTKPIIKYHRHCAVKYFEWISRNRKRVIKLEDRTIKSSSASDFIHIRFGKTWIKKKKDGEWLKITSKGGKRLFGQID